MHGDSPLCSPMAGLTCRRRLWPWALRSGPCNRKPPTSCICYNNHRAQALSPSAGQPRTSPTDEPGDECLIQAVGMCRHRCNTSIASAGPNNAVWDTTGWCSARPYLRCCCWPSTFTHERMWRTIETSGACQLGVHPRKVAASVGESRAKPSSRSSAKAIAQLDDSHLRPFLISHHK